MTLDVGQDELRRLLDKAADIAVRLHTDIEAKKVFHGKSPSEVKGLFDEGLPENPSGIGSLLETIEKDVYGSSTFHFSPHFYAYVTSTNNPAAILSDFLVTALNQNCAKWHTGASSCEIEPLVIRWVADFIKYPSDTGGAIVSGGSMANFTCLAVARKSRSDTDVASEGLKLGKQLTAYISSEGHSCFDKSIDMLGIGKKYLRKIPVKDDFTIDVQKLEEAVARDKGMGYQPFCVIGNAGTVNTGAVDPLDSLAELCKKEGLWFHVDAAYGGPAAATDIVGQLFKGLDKADSVALDPHKWLYVPFEAGCALVMDKKLLRDTFSIVPEYIRQGTDSDQRHNIFEYKFELSNRFKALNIWMTFKAYGAKKLREEISNNIKVMRYLSELIKKSKDFELLAPAPLSAVCFRYSPATRRDDDYLNELNQKLAAEAENDRRVFLSTTSINGMTSLRACCTNHRRSKKHVEYLIEVLRELGSGIDEDRVE